jgi:predicted nucleic acid-binding protein
VRYALRIRRSPESAQTMKRAGQKTSVSTVSTSFWPRFTRMIALTQTLRECPDDPDNRFLECAGEAKASFPITRNKRHSLPVGRALAS